jgi:hypothetical protein
MSTPRTNINRLLRLAGLLRSLPPEQVDMNHVAYESTCGTVCCIAGWATRVHPDLTLGPPNDGGDRYLRHKGKENLSYHDCFAEAFGLDMDTAVELTRANAPHRTPAACALAVERVAADLAVQHGYEIVEA